jgi:D-alanyl-D-alanine carboxypeptidase
MSFKYLGEPAMPRAAMGRQASWTRSAPAVSAGRGRRAIHVAAAIVLVAALAVPAPSEAAAKAGSPAQAEHRKGAKSKQSVHHRHHRFLHGPDYQPPYADIVVDDNSDQVLHETNPDSPRHPASLTKIMTLYVLFEQLQAKKLGLDSRLPVSAHASAQAPTKLGLRPNDTISVEDAIKGIVTRSANDAAVVIAEAIAGSEREFAALMTGKAQTLGMANTVYVNASGLPADAQITTAREQALLGRAIQERFPEYYRYFALPSFQYRGMSISNHNALLRQMEGVDGIKTGYTEASGYNLVSSVRREGRHLVAVVLGGRSTGTRDSRMRQLIEGYIGRASTTRTAPAIVDVADPATEVPSKTALPLPPPENEPPNAMPAPTAQEPASISLEHTP